MTIMPVAGGNRADGCREPVRAAIISGNTETPYARLGSGATVVLLRAGGECEGEPSALFSALATRFRVIAPVPVAPGDAQPAVAFGEWLRDFLDGVGVERACFVAEGELGTPALDFAMSDPSRVHRMVLLAAGAPGTATCEMLVAVFGCAEGTDHVGLSREAQDGNGAPGVAGEDEFGGLLRFLAGGAGDD